MIDLQSPSASPSDVILTTINAPPSLPVTDPAPAGAPTLIRIEPRSKQDEETESFLEDYAKDFRDNINALARDLWKYPLLLLNEERVLHDIYKDVRTKEEFAYRLQALIGLIPLINTDMISEVVNETISGNHSIMGLERLLVQQGMADEAAASDLVWPLKEIIYLRHGYPAHGDYIDKVISAHRALGLGYPITQYALAWDKLIGLYHSTLEELLRLLQLRLERK